jgi:diacylglycerol kinase (ATP)
MLVETRVVAFAASMSAEAVRFLVNPAAGRGAGKAHLNELRTLASRANAGFVVTRDAADLVDHARRAVADGITRLVVAGGDGTQHWAAQALAGTDCALAVVPLGTGNDLAATLRLPSDLEPAVRQALTGPVRSIDLVRVGDRYAIGYVGVGFDAEVARFANREVKLLRGPLVYFYAVIHTLITFEPPSFTVESDHGHFSGRAMFVVAANLPRFGGGMLIAPDAAIDDGLLDLVILREVSRPGLLRVFPKVYGGRHVDHPAVSIERTTKVTITVDREMSVYGGGEPLTTAVAGEPITVAVAAGALRVVAGAVAP